MSLYGRFTRVGPSGFGHASTAEQVAAGLDLSGQTWLVTGSNSGLGAETCRVLSSRGARVLATARTPAKAEAAVASLSGAVPLVCELSDIHSVRRCVAAVRDLDHPLDGIITNAGVMALQTRELCYGIEKQFFVNHVAHFVLVTELLDWLTPQARVVSLSSSAHTNPPRGGIAKDLSFGRGYSPWKAYGQSKLANLLFARELARRLGDGTGQMACAVHPGVILTNLARHLGLVRHVAKSLASVFLKSVEEGAATQVWAAVRGDAATLHGEYLMDCNVAASTALGADPDLALRLWETTAERVEGLPR